MLRKHTEEALHRAVHYASSLIESGDDWVAVAVVGDHVDVCHNYWPEPSEPSEVGSSARKFERELARNAHEPYGALAVPVIWREIDTGAMFRNPRKEAVEDETRMLFCITWDTRDSFDVHRLLYTRRPNGEPVFGVLETLSGQAKLPKEAPGFALLQSVVQPGGQA